MPFWKGATVKKLKQAIVGKLFRLDPNQATEELALFNPDGSPFIGVHNQPPKRGARWAQKEGTATRLQKQKGGKRSAGGMRQGGDRGLESGPGTRNGWA